MQTMWTAFTLNTELDVYMRWQNNQILSSVFYHLFDKNSVSVETICVWPFISPA